MHGPDKVHAIGYRPLTGPRSVWPGWPIARTMLVLGWRQRSTKFALLACFSVFAAHAMWVVGLLLSRKIMGDTPASIMGMDGLVGSVHGALSRYVSVQFFATALALAVVAAGAVAEDRHAGAFELYFSRPLTRMQYALGKLLGAGLLSVATLVVPVFLLWLTAVGIAPESIRSELWWLVVPAVGSAVLAGMVLTAVIIGLSALGQRARTVGVVFIAGLLLLTGLTEGLCQGGYLIFGYLSPERDLRTVVDWLLHVGAHSVAAQFTGGGLPTNASPYGSLLGLLAWTGVGLSALALRIKSEVRAG
jgi:hypothetical protein